MHPLTLDAAAIRSSGGWLDVRAVDQCPPQNQCPPEAPTLAANRWVRCADALDALPAWTARVDAELRRRHAHVPAAVAATYLMGWYLDVAARPGALWVGLRDRLPELDAAALWFRETPGGWPDAVAVGSRRFRCLPDDPQVDHPDARPVADRDALLATLATMLRGYADQFFDRFEPAVKIGSRQRLGMLSDTLEAALWAAGDLRRDPFAGDDDATTAVGANPTRRRRSCCFAYQLDPALLCARCPRRSSRR